MNKYIPKVSMKLVNYIIFITVFLIILFSCVLMFKILLRTTNVDEKPTFSNKQRSGSSMPEKRVLGTRNLPVKKLSLRRRLINKKKRIKKIILLPEYDTATKTFMPSSHFGGLSYTDVSFRFKKTPYIESSSGRRNKKSEKDWLEITTNYETTTPWIDDLVLVYYALFNDPATKEAVVLRTEVPYRCIGKGSHLAKAYIPPRVLRRYDMPESVMVLAYVNQQFVAVDNIPNHGDILWWKTDNYIEGLILSIDKTPFFYLPNGNLEQLNH